MVRVRLKGPAEEFICNLSPSLSPNPAIIPVLLKIMDPKSQTATSVPEIWKWFNEVLKSPAHVVAPMVDASELPWRLLTRRYGADLCFTPMIHSKNFLKDIKYRNEIINSCNCAEDRPLIAQFCGNDPTTLKEAAKLIAPHVDGIDLNLGCPQKIAKAGHYGAFLQDEWDLISKIVRGIADMGIPISCKIRIFEDMDKTLRYAKMLEDSGCWMLTVHGRTRDQKGRLTGLATWDYVKVIKSALKIPVLSNGNTDYLSDVAACRSYTGVDGIMSAEGILHNPALFSGKHPRVWELGLEYLELVKEYPCPISYIRGHLFKIYQHLISMEENHDLRDQLGRSNTMENFRETTLQLKERYEPYANSTKDTTLRIQEIDLPFPPWIAQPYHRPPPTTSIPDPHLPPNTPDTEPPKAKEPKMSKKQLKRMARHPNRDWKSPKKSMVLCVDCVNPAGVGCDWKCCKRCCLIKCTAEFVECLKHKILLQFLNPPPANLTEPGNVNIQQLQSV